MISALPYETLQCILTFVMTDCVDSNPSHIRAYAAWPICVTPEGTSRLASLARVDQRWGSAATHLLYRSIVIRPKKSAALLHRTLSASSTLPSRVRAISVDVGDDGTTSEHHIAILDLCPNVQHVVLHRAAGSQAYYRALAARRRLRSIRVTIESENPWIKAPPFCSFSDLASMMRGWPELEWVSADEGTIIELDMGLDNLEALPQLKAVRIGGNLTESNVLALSRLAPNMESFANVDALAFPKGMHNALAAWRQTLISLELCAGDSGSDGDMQGWLMVSNAMSSLPHLQKLLVGERAPAFIISNAFPPTIRSLDLWIHSDDLPILASALERKEYVPFLQNISVSVSFACEVGTFRPEDVEQLRVVCERRGVMTNEVGWDG